MAGKFKQGIYTPKYPEKYIGNVNNIVYRSSWERKLMFKLDISPNVLKWSSEECPIRYWDSVKKKTRRYFIDFYVIFKSVGGENVRMAIEVKPYSQTLPPKKPKRNTAKAQKRYLRECITYQNNMDKWKSAKRWCEANNFKFVILHEKNVNGLFS